MQRLNLKQLAERSQGFAPGHRACAGCAFPSIIRMLLAAGADYDLVIANATGCMEVVTTIMPYTAWPVPWVHNAFENAGATISGIERAYKALLKRGKIKNAKKPVKFVAIGGDGGTYDIGLQALSGAIERGHDFLYVLYDNEGYMNTGIQRSSATPLHAHTTTSPAGTVIPGKQQPRKDLTKIIAMHRPRYAAQGAPAFWNDLVKKFQKGLEVDGPAFVAVLSTCPPGWGTPENMSIELTKLAVETRFWPLYEYEDGYWKVNYKPRKFVPVEEFLKHQGRFKHIMKNPELIKEIQDEIEKNWKELLWLESRKKEEEK